MNVNFKKAVEKAYERHIWLYKMGTTRDLKMLSLKKTGMNALKPRHNTEKSIVGSLRGEFYIKSGKNRAAAARTSTPEVLILQSSADVLSILTRS